MLLYHVVRQVFLPLCALQVDPANRAYKDMLVVREGHMRSERPLDILALDAVRDTKCAAVPVALAPFFLLHRGRMLVVVVLSFAETGRLVVPGEHAAGAEIAITQPRLTASDNLEDEAWLGKCQVVEGEELREGDVPGEVHDGDGWVPYCIVRSKVGDSIRHAWICLGLLDRGFNPPKRALLGPRVRMSYSIKRDHTSRLTLWVEIGERVVRRYAESEIKAEGPRKTGRESGDYMVCGLYGSEFPVLDEERDGW